MADRRYSVVYRLMHWSIAICMMLLLLTIFLRFTWLNKNNLADIIQPYMANADLTLSHDKVIALAKQIRKPMWNWHIYLGCILSLLFLVRITLHFNGKMKLPNPFKKGLKPKYRFKLSVFLLFYIFLALSLITGLLIQFGPHELGKSLEGAHSLSIYYLVVFVFLHLGGILLAEFTSRRGIISGIISGGK